MSFPDSRRWSHKPRGTFSYTLALRVTPVVGGCRIEIVARIQHHDMIAPVEALVATIDRALNVEVRTNPIGTHAHTEDAGIHRAEQAVRTVVSAQTKLNSSAGRTQRR
jgi:hypothetical protein